MADLTIDLILEDERFKKALRDATKTAKKSGREIGEGITKPVKSSFDQIGSIAKGFVVGSVLLQLPRILGNAFSTVTQAAIKQEDAVNDLNAALKRTGSFSESASKDLQGFASELQRQSVIGDEVILSQLAYAKSLGVSNDQAKEFVTAALNASAALGRDFNGTLVQLLKTLSGVQGEVKELVPQIGNLTAEQLKAGGAAKLFNDQFAGAFIAQTNTTSGKISQLANSFGDFQEKLGKFIISSKEASATINQLTQFFDRLNIKLSDTPADRVKALRIEISDLQRDTLLLQESIKGKNEFLPEVSQTLQDIGRNKEEIRTLTKYYAALKATIKDGNDSGGFTARILSQKEIDDAVNAFRTIGITQIEQIRLAEREQVAALEKARAFNDDRILSEQDFQIRLSEVKSQAAEQERIKIEELRQSQFVFEEEQRQLLLNREMNLADFASNSSDVFGALAKEFQVTSKDIGRSIIQGIGGGAGSAFAAFGKAIATGENALEAFAKALFQSISQQAVALGTSYILQGTAMLFSPNPLDNKKAPFLLKSGAALAAFGGALSGLSSGSAGGAQSSGLAGSNSPEFQPQDNLRTNSITEERLDPETRVTLNIQGDILDSEESSLRIVRLLENASLNNNVRVIGGLA